MTTTKQDDSIPDEEDLKVDLPEVDFEALLKSALPVENSEVDLPEEDLKVDWSSEDFEALLKSTLPVENSEVDWSSEDFEALLKSAWSEEDLKGDWSSEDLKGDWPVVDWAFDLSEEEIPEPDPNLTEADVANWMLQQVEHGILDQKRAAYHIRRYFGEKFVYLNRNGNPAISREVLKEFLKITLHTVVWNRKERFWRQRRPGDPRRSRAVDD